MIKIITAIVKRNWRRFQGYCEGVAHAITNDDAEAKSKNLRGIFGMLISRLAIWGIAGFILTLTGCDWLTYGQLLFAAYVVAIGLTVFSDDEPPASTNPDEPPATTNPAEPPLSTVDEATTIRHARAEVDIILDISLVVLSDVAKHHAIEVPNTKERLAYPRKSECIRLDNGVPVITVMARQTGEVNSAEVCADFNLTLGQLSDGHKLPNAPAPVYWDAEQNAIQSIQAVGHYIVGRYVVLDIVHVKDESSATYVNSNAPLNTDGSEPPLPPTSPYFR